MTSRAVHGRDFAFGGFVLAAYLVILGAINSAGLTRRWPAMQLLPSLWMLGATIYWTRRGGALGYFGIRTRTSLVAAIGAAALSLALYAIAARLPRPELVRAIANVVILAPFAEEYFFRGMTLGVFVESCGRLAGALLASALFALMHAPQGIFVQMFVMSLILCAAVLKTKNVLAAVAIHLGWNMIVVYYQSGK